MKSIVDGNVCPKCGAQLPAATVLCERCGHRAHAPIPWVPIGIALAAFFIVAPWLSAANPSGEAATTTVAASPTPVPAVTAAPEQDDASGRTVESRAKPQISQRELARLIVRAEDLYRISDGGVSSYFYEQERRFQDDLNALDAGEAGTAMWDGRVRLEQFDNFLYNSSIHHDCPAAARAERRIAREILDHAELDARGRSQTEWMPDLGAVPDC